VVVEVVGFVKSTFLCGDMGGLTGFGRLHGSCKSLIGIVVLALMNCCSWLVGNCWMLSEKCRKADIWWCYDFGNVGFGGSDCIPGYI